MVRIRDIEGKKHVARVAVKELIAKICSFSYIIRQNLYFCICNYRKFV